MVPSPGLVLRCVGVIWVSIGVFTAVATLPGGGVEGKSIKIKQNRPKTIQIVQNGAPYPTKREQREPFFEAVELYFFVSRSHENQKSLITLQRAPIRAGQCHHGHRRPQHRGGFYGCPGSVRHRCKAMYDFSFLRSPKTALRFLGGGVGGKSINIKQNRPKCIKNLTTAVGTLAVAQTSRRR